MSGCMLCTSLGIAASQIIAYHADYIDHDGPLFLEKDRDHALSYHIERVSIARSSLWGWMMDVLQLLNAKGVLPSKSVIENLTLLSKQYGIETYLLTTSEKKYILKLNKNPTNQLTVLKKIYEDLWDIKFISLKMYYSDNDLLLMEYLSLIHIWRCRRSYACRSRWSPYH